MDINAIRRTYYHLFVLSIFLDVTVFSFLINIIGSFIVFGGTFSHENIIFVTSVTIREDTLNITNSVTVNRLCYVHYFIDISCLCNLITYLIKIKFDTIRLSYFIGKTLNIIV